MKITSQLPILTSSEKQEFVYKNLKTHNKDDVNKLMITTIRNINGITLKGLLPEIENLAAAQDLYKKVLFFHITPTYEFIEKRAQNCWNIPNHWPSDTNETNKCQWQQNQKM